MQKKILGFSKIYQKLLIGIGAGLILLGVAIPRGVSFLSFPGDGQLLVIHPSVSGDYNPSGQSEKMVLYIPGVVRNGSNQRLGNLIAQKKNYPIEVIYNGSSCQSDRGNCVKWGDYLKAFLNRLNNPVLGRGNEKIIRSLRERLSQILKDNSSVRIEIIGQSEGTLIIYSAIEDLLDKSVDLRRIELILMGSPLPEHKITQLTKIVGKVKVISNPGDPFTCLQKGVINWSFKNFPDLQNWLLIKPETKKCWVEGDFSQHDCTLYIEQNF